MKKALIIMTRVPIPGRTKTRLMSRLSGEQCSELHRAFIMDIFSTAGKLTKDIDIFLTYTPEKSFGLMKDIVPEYMSVFPQEGASLGERMLNSIDKLISKGYSKVILIGTDIPELKSADIERAYELLDSSDLCLGPTMDGGYYLIGMKRSIKEILLNDLKWGNKTVLESTIAIANELQLKVSLAEKHRDIDTWEDLQALMRSLNSGRFSDQELPLNTANLLGIYEVNKYVEGYSCPEDKRIYAEE